jgi:hypothetical protein
VDEPTVETLLADQEIPRLRELFRLVLPLMIEGELFTIANSGDDVPGQVNGPSALPFAGQLQDRFDSGGVEGGAVRGQGCIGSPHGVTSQADRSPFELVERYDYLLAPSANEPRYEPLQYLQVLAQ